MFSLAMMTEYYLSNHERLLSNHQIEEHQEGREDHKEKEDPLIERIVIHFRLDIKDFAVFFCSVHLRPIHQFRIEHRKEADAAQNADDDKDRKLDSGRKNRSEYQGGKSKQQRGGKIDKETEGRESKVNPVMIQGDEIAEDHRDES